jgi:hypothetical protein
MNPKTDPWIIFGVKQMDVFDKDNIAFVSCLVSGDGLRKCMIEVYRAIVKFKFVPPIEDVDIREEEKIWLRANAVDENRILTKEQLIELSKALYVIECFQKK